MEKVKKIVYVALFTALITVCAMITIPGTVPFTLQTFAVFMALYCLGGMLGTCSIVLYILLGIVGLPIFAGFKGGLGVIVSSTGGYIIGFIVVGLVYWLFESLRLKHFSIISSVIGLMLLYLLGTIWFVWIANNHKNTGFATALLLCVVPFIMPDLLKLGLAYLLAGKVKKFIKIGEKKNT